MKTASVPSLRVESELREAAEQVLQDRESLSGFIEAAVRETIERRRTRAECRSVAARADHSFGHTSSVALFEIDDASTVTLLAAPTRR